MSALVTCEHVYSDGIRQGVAGRAGVHPAVLDRAPPHLQGAPPHHLGVPLHPLTLSLVMLMPPLLEVLSRWSPRYQRMWLAAVTCPLVMQVMFRTLPSRM